MNFRPTFKSITEELLQRVNMRAQKCTRKGNSRATVAIIVQHMETGLFLIVYGRDISSPSPYSNPGIPKGEKRKREHVLRAAAREILEEIGIPESLIKFQTYGGSCSVISRKKKGGVPKKQYFIFHALYTGPLELTVDPREVLGYQWVTLKEVKKSLRVLKSTRPDKYNALVKSFSALKRSRLNLSVAAPSSEVT